MKPRVVVQLDAETKRWSAVFPELPGCASAGDTEAEAIANAKEALALWFEPAPVKFAKGAKLLELAVARTIAFHFAAGGKQLKRAAAWPRARGAKEQPPKWRHANGRQMIVAMHGSKPIPVSTLKSIIEGGGPVLEVSSDECWR